MFERTTKHNANVAFELKGVKTMIGKAPWSLGEVLALHLLRISAVWLAARYFYPLLFFPTALTVEITDRVIILLLVIWAVHRHRSRLDFFGMNLRFLGRDIQWGLFAGFAMLTVSVYSERIYTTMFLLTPSQHPLAVQAAHAGSLRELAVPLILAGIAAPVAEEVLYRLYTFVPLKDRFGLWGGALLSALIFSLFHFNAYWLAELIVIGLGLSLLYYWSGSLVCSMIAHSFINTAKVLMIYFNVPGI